MITWPVASIIIGLSITIAGVFVKIFLGNKTNDDSALKEDIKEMKDELKLIHERINKLNEKMENKFDKIFQEILQWFKTK